MLLHKNFDELWTTPEDRAKAYALLSNEAGLPVGEVHFSAISRLETAFLVMDAVNRLRERYGLKETHDDQDIRRMYEKPESGAVLIS